MSVNKKFIMAVVLVASIALLAGCAGQTRVAKIGDNVTVDYALWVENNTTMLETSNATWAVQAGIYNAQLEPYPPLWFVIGDEQYLPSFENATIGMKVGETKNITLLPADAYGDYDISAIQPVNMSEFEAINITPHINEMLNDIYYWPVRVDSIDVNNSTVYVDFNSPMAGKTLHFMITVRSIGTPAPMTA